MNLVIVESPTKAKTLSKILGKEFEIKASMGHIRDLPKSGLGVDVKHNFKPEYVVPDKAQKTLKELKKISSKAEVIVLAPDPDREGEAIAWHLSELLNHKEKPKFLRVVFHELTESAVKKAFENPGKLNMNLVDAQQARRVLDRLVGYKLSPLLWKKVRYGLSAGRVQSVAVRLIVEKEREREEFKIEEYWSVHTDFVDNSKKRGFTAELTQKDEKKLEITNQQEAEKLEKELKDDKFEISEVRKTQKSKKPYAPLKTSTLQQAMANMYGFSAKKTMISAQRLFEEGHITYHRTDSLNLSNDFISEVRNFVSKKFGNNYIPSKGVFYKTKEKNAQEAHEAIRPTNVLRLPSEIKNLTPDQRKVYTIVWTRAVESQMNDAIYDQTSMTVKSDKGYILKASGSVIKYDGWLAVGEFLGIKENGNGLEKLPEYESGEKVFLKDLKSEQHFTQPPARYSDATLIKKLEELGIGRPSTYAPTLSTIQQRGYVDKENRYFVPKDVAYVVTDLLVKHFKDIVDYDFTAKMEEDLDTIADGEKDWEPVIREFYEPFEKTLEKKEKELQKMDITTIKETKEKCPECGRNLVVKLGKYGTFLSCSGYPECKYAEATDEDKVYDEKGKEIEDFGDCPNCEGGHFILRQGRFGKFLACSNYPKCKTTKPFLEKIGIKCPKCKEGDVITRKAKGREFFGCSRYPDCDFSSWQDPRDPKWEYDPEKHSSNKKDKDSSSKKQVKKKSKVKGSKKTSKRKKIDKNK